MLVLQPLVLRTLIAYIILQLAYPQVIGTESAQHAAGAMATLVDGQLPQAGPVCRGAAMPDIATFISPQRMALAWNTLRQECRLHPRCVL